MTQKFLVSAFVGALALVGAQAASAEDWVPAGAAASLTVAAPAQVVSADTSSNTQVASWAPAGAAASMPSGKEVAVASNSGH